MDFTWLSRWQPQLLALLRIVAGLFCFVFLYIAAAGPGTWSIDRARSRSAAR